MAAARFIAVSNGMISGVPGVPFTRRALMQGALAGTAGLLLGDRVWGADAQPKAETAPAKTPAGKAKAVIQVWLSGGPSHTDTFDPKPDSGSEYTGGWNHPIETNVKGIRIAENMPIMAKVADKFSIIRSMTHRQNGHETASYMVQTGRMPGGRYVMPMVGAVVTAFKGFQKGDTSLIPPYIVLTQPQGRFSESGFLGIRYKPFATGGDPNAFKFAVEGIVAPGISDEQQKERRELLDKLNTLGKWMKDDPRMVAAEQAKQQAYDLILGDAGKVFDLSEEKDELRARYGKHVLGQSCLAARRLIEKGVKYVTINQFAWDTHKEHFPAMRRMLPQLDSAVGTLIADLADRGLLDSTIVWVGGEFGRTPKIAFESPWNGGRHHFGNVFSHVVAGGGFKGGMVVGASCPKGEEPVSRPVYPCDLIGSIYQLLGIDPDGNLPHPMGDIVKATPAPEEGVLAAGRLKEIM
jgi:hypothetical protein